jgi:hypothetical protein
MKTLERTFVAFGWTFDLEFNNETGTEFKKIYRDVSILGKTTFVEEGSDLEDELIKALKTHKGFLNFEDDAYHDLNAEDEYEEDWEYDCMDEGDAFSAKDDEMGQ